jgi:hypothetical protein
MSVLAVENAAKDAALFPAGAVFASHMQTPTGLKRKTNADKKAAVAADTDEIGSGMQVRDRRVADCRLNCAR